MTLLSTVDKKQTGKSPKVSVIVATYRRNYSLKSALDSLIKQTYEPIEIIVVDDNADIAWNNTVRDIVNQINNIHPIIYIRNEINKGSAETRNIGIREASGEYITFLDDDDIYLPKKNENQIKHMLENETDFSITDLMLLNENNKLIEYRDRAYIKSFDSDNLLKYHLMYHMTGTDTIMFKREYLLEIGGFGPVDIGDEFYLILKAIIKGGKFSYLSNCDVKAYVHSRSDGLSSGDSKITGENKLYQYKKRYFKFLNSSEIHWIIMRHYAVLSYTEYRRKRLDKFILYALIAFIASPLKFVKEFLRIVF